MTREKGYYKPCRTCVNDACIFIGTEDTHYVCIDYKALEQEPCGDAINRQTVKDLGAECIAKRDENGNLIPLGSIDSLPSVSTGKTGLWEEIQFRTIPYNRISKAKKCSVCGKRKDKYVTWNYCPNCGAKMEVGE